MTDMTELLLYCAARAQHTERVIKPALESGRTVFCDRYCDSTAAYQGYARGIHIDVVNALNRAAMCGVSIDWTILMDVPPDKGFARKGGAQESDRLERETLAFHKKVYGGYLSLLKKYARIRPVACGGTKFETHEKIVALLKDEGLIN